MDQDTNQQNIDLASIPQPQITQSHDDYSTTPPTHLFHPQQKRENANIF